MSNKTCRKYIKAFLSIAAVISLFSCGTRNVSSDSEVVAKTPVTVTSPVIKDLKETAEFPAVSSYIVKNTVRAATAGIVEQVSIAPGEQVQAGALLFTLKTREAAALQNAASTDTTLNFRGIIKIHSPGAGIISSILHQAGDLVQEGDELAVLSDIKSLVFIMEVPFEMKGIADRNKECILRLPDSSRVTGIILRRLSEMNVQDQTVSYIVQPVSDRYLPQNLVASAILVKGTEKNATVLPREAVLGNETQTQFWVMKVINDSTAVRIPVVKGIENRQEVEITSPVLLPDDRILRTGNYGLPDTAAITISK